MMEERLQQLSTGVEKLQYRLTRLAKFNPHHSPATGQFSSGGSGAVGGGSGKPTAGDFKVLDGLLKPHKAEQLKTLSDGSRVYGSKKNAGSPFAATTTVHPDGS